MVGRSLPLLALVFTVVLVVASSRSSNGGGGRDEGLLPDVSLVIKYERTYNSWSRPTPLSAYCATGDLRLSLDLAVLPNNTYNPNHHATDTYKTVTLDEFTGVGGVICSTGGKQDVTGPIIQPQATIIPRRPSVTLNKGEDLWLPLDTLRRRVWWRMEPSQDNIWNNATLTEDSQLLIPSHKLQEPGVYLVMVQPADTHTFQWANEYGTFVVMVRECPEQRYGEACAAWCSNCFHGGVCDERSGECVCPAGVMGHRCQTICPDGYIGRHCTVPLDDNPVSQVVCTSASLGCTCAPGYHGENCDTRCSDDTWGADCTQTCHDCYGSCTQSGCVGRKGCSRWGRCQGTQRRHYKQGDLGLPRLRQPPNVISVTSQSAVVSFEAWRQDYDDGELPSGGSFSYLLRYWPDGDTSAAKDVTVHTAPSTIHLTDLHPDTTYHMKVVVVVVVGGESSALDGTDLGRVHSATFTTSCPSLPQPQAPLNVTTNSTSLTVHWPVMRLDMCTLQYKLQVTSGKYIQTFNMTGTYYKVEDLKPNTEYTLFLYTCDQNMVQCSAPLSTTRRTRPGALVLQGHREGSEVVFSWGPARGSLDHLEVAAEYQIMSEGTIWQSWTTLPQRDSNKTSARIPAFPYTTVILRASIKNQEQSVQGNFPRVYIPPSEPGPVKRLSVVLSAASLLVTWDEPANHPPKGKLQSFRVTWKEAGQPSTRENQVMPLDAREFSITQLKPNTTYEIMVEAKNQDVDQYGAAATTTITTTTTTTTSTTTTTITTLGVPSQVAGLNATGTESSLTLTWLPPKTVTGVPVWYSLLLYSSADLILERNISATITQVKAKVEALGEGQEYRATVAACNMQRCGDVMEATYWTRPSPPRLQGTVGIQTTSNTDAIIVLPRLTNPPGWQYVMVQREGQQQQQLTQQWNDTLRNTALTLTRTAEEEDHPPSSQHSAKEEETGASPMYIAAKLLQNRDERQILTVGDSRTYEDRYLNRPLTKDVAYWIVVVTERRRGPGVEWVASVPCRFVTTSAVQLRLILGLGAALVVIAAAVAAVVIVVLYLRKRKSRYISRQENDNSFDTPWTEHFKVSFSNALENIYEENSYTNATLEVNERDLEAYLLRAVLSRDTKIEFENVPSFMSTSYSESECPENRSKNRYMNKVTYDDTRVILPLYNDIPHSDYINANYIKVPSRPAAFIASEDPTEETVGAFWRMTWHADCRVILMMANLREGTKVKVAQYWPEVRPWTTEGVTVTPTGVTVKMDFVIRTFTVSVGNTKKKVSQYQYTAWPDHGVPKMPYGLAQMIKLIRRDHSREQLITVHCSAGIGRTGTVILVMSLMDQLQERGAVNPREALTVLRRGRGRLVENTEQYIFAHQVLHEVLFSLDTSIRCHAFKQQLSALRSPQPPDGVSTLQRQYKKLQSFPKDLTFKYGNDPACAHLNRNQDVLPADSRMVFVQGKGNGADTQYINVIRINGIDQRDEYLAGEHPQRHTLDKVWRLVYQRRVAVWVAVHTFPHADPEFPDVVCESSALLGNITLTASPIQAFQYYDERHVDITVTELGNVTKHKCLLISLRGWPAADCLPACPQPLLAAIEKAEALTSQQQPPLFTCKDGVTGCGVMAALLLAVSRAKLLQEVDIYRSVASIQQDRPQFVVSLQQYEFLHTALAAFLDNNSHYGNFD